MEHSQTFSAIALALAKAQAKFKDAERDRDNPFFSSTYSTMAAVLGACREALTENEIATVQATEHVENDDEHLQVDTMLIHSSGEWFRTKLKVRVMAMKVEKGDRDAGTAAVKMITPQAMGSASTYACRIALRSLVVVASEAAEDDDGNAASGKKAADGIFLDVITDVTSETKKGKGDRAFTIHRIATGEHGELATFDAALADEARKYKGTGQQVEIEGKKNPKGFGWDLASVRPPAPAGQEGQGGHPQQYPSQGQGPATHGQQPPPAPAAGPFKPAVVEFDDVIIDSSTKGKGQDAQYGLKTEKHGWVGMRDIKIFSKLEKLKGSGFPVHFKAKTREDKRYDLIEGHEIEPPPPPEETAPETTQAQPGVDPAASPSESRPLDLAAKAPVNEPAQAAAPAAAETSPTIAPAVHVPAAP